MSDSIDVVALRFVSAGGEAVLSDAQRVRAGVEESLNRSIAAGKQFLATINGEAATAIQSSLQLAEAVKLVDVQNRASVAGWIKTRDAALEYAESCGVLAETQLHLGSATQFLILGQQEYAGYLKESAVATRELNASQIASAESSGLHGLQLGRVNQELGTFIGRVTGGNTAVTRLAAQIGGAAAGYGPMIAGLVGLGAVLWVWERFTGDTKEAQKALAEFQKTSEAMSATNAAIGSLKQGASAAGFDAHLGDIPALSEDAKKAADVVDDLQKKLSGLLSGSLNGNAVLAPLREIANSASQGHLTLGQLDASLGAIPEIARYFPTIAKDVGEYSAQLIVALGAQDRVKNSLLQAAAVHRYYTDELKAATVGEGQLLEKIAQAQTILAAFQGGGTVAGKRAEDDAKAYDAAQKVYEDYAKSAKGASVATIAFGDAYKNTLSAGHEIAVSFFNEQKQLFELNTKIADAQKQAATGMSDDGRIASLTDQIARLAQEADSFGKDGSIQNRIEGLDDQLDQFLGTLQQQVALGKLSSASFEAQATAVEGLRQNLYSAGDALRQVADAQITKQIHDEYLAQKELFDGVTAGVGGVRELTAAKAAELEIAQRRVQLGHDLSQEMQDEILHTKQLAVATSESATTQGMQQRLDALLQENEAMRAGESTRATYAINQRADLEITKALTLSTVDLAAARILVVNATRAAELAHLGLANAEKQGQHATAELLKEQRELAKVFEQDLVRAIEQFTTRGLSSFTDFFGEIQRLSLQMVAQIDNSMRKIHDATEESIYSGSDAEFGKLSSESDRLGGLRKTAGYAATVISAGTAGYNIGSQSGSYTTGAIGGAASGAALGASIAGPWGAVVGGVTGLVSGLWGAHDKLKELRKQYEQTEGDFIKHLTGYASSYAQQFDSISQSMKDLEASAAKAGTTVSGEAQRAAAIAQGKITTDFLGDLTQRLNALHGAAGDTANQIDALNKKHLEDLQTVKALGLGTEAASQADQVWIESINAIGAAQAASIAAQNDADFAAFSQRNQTAHDKDLSDLNTAFQAANALAQKQLDTANAALTVAKDQLSAQQNTVKSLQATVDALNKYSSSLLLSPQSTLSPVEQYNEAKRQLDAAAAAARGGDQDAAKNLPDIANQFLQLSKGMFSTTSPYGSDFDYVQSLVNGLTDKYTNQLTTEQLVLQQMQTQTDLLQKQVDLLNLIAHPKSYVVGSTDDPSFIASQMRQLYTPPPPPPYQPGSTPGYASGGSFGGGMRIVGERGPELEMTGPSRILNNRELASLIGGAGSNQEQTALLKEQNQLLKQQNALIAKGNDAQRSTTQRVADKVDTLVKLGMFADRNTGTG